MAKKKVVTTPLNEFMIPVTNYNKKKLEKKHGITIPDDVTFIIPPDVIYSDTRFWDAANQHPAPEPHSTEEVLEIVSEEVWLVVEEKSRKRFPR